MNEETKQKLRETRKQMMNKLEETMLKGKSPEDSVFYYHSSEDRIVLSCLILGGKSPLARMAVPI